MEPTSDPPPSRSDRPVTHDRPPELAPATAANQPAGQPPGAGGWQQTSHHINPGVGLMPAWSGTATKEATT